MDIGLNVGSIPNSENCGHAQWNGRNFIPTLTRNIYKIRKIRLKLPFSGTYTTTQSDLF
jgi:hypothetical protein